jgi:lipoprotein-anchoring transpeptidase ErfK/SrfK
VPRRLAAATLPALAAVLACDSAAAADVPWPEPLQPSTVVRAHALGRPIVVQPGDPRQQMVLPWPAPLRSSAYDRAQLAGQPIATIARATRVFAKPGGRKIATLAAHTEFGTPRWLAVVGHRKGWLRVIATELRNGQTGWIRELRTRIQATPWAIRASISRRRVQVMKNGRVVRSFTVAVGKPSTPTLPGRFGVTDKLRYKGGSVAYGCCVLGLTGHLPYPGNGSRMAIHGTSAPSTIGRPASFGCLRASEADMRWLLKNVWLGSVVKISA